MGRDCAGRQAMLIKIRRGWEIPERLVTPEELVMPTLYSCNGA